MPSMRPVIVPLSGAWTVDKEAPDLQPMSEAGSTLRGMMPGGSPPAAEA